MRPMHWLTKEEAQLNEDLEKEEKEEKEQTTTINQGTNGENKTANNQMINLQNGEGDDDNNGENNEDNNII